jgi:predicted dipeptidase
MLASLYSLKLLMEDGVEFNKRIRFIFCTDEESLWRCVKAYREKEEHPTLGFTPDSDFPLVYAEKGLIEYTLTTKEHIGYPLEGGTALNAVPASVTVVEDGEIENALKDLNYSYKKENGKINVIGKTAHAMRANEGINAITRLCEALANAGKRGRMLDFILNVGMDPLGKPILGDMHDYTGGVTFNIGMADFKAEEQSLSIDIRFPATKTKEEVDKLMRQAAKDWGVDIEEFDYLAPLYVDPKSDLVIKLIKAYQDVTGDTKSQPMTMGGATFARSMDNIIAFGATLPGAIVSEHEANERVKSEDIMIAMEVYMHAFINLAID